MSILFRRNFSSVSRSSFISCVGISSLFPFSSTSLLYCSFSSSSRFSHLPNTSNSSSTSQETSDEKPRKKTKYAKIINMTEIPQQTADFTVPQQSKLIMDIGHIRYSPTHIY